MNREAKNKSTTHVHYISLQFGQLIQIKKVKKDLLSFFNAEVRTIHVRP